jgi:hypothetical protein
MLEMLAHLVSELAIDGVGLDERPQAHAKTGQPPHQGAPEERKDRKGRKVFFVFAVFAAFAFFIPF